MLRSFRALSTVSSAQARSHGFLTSHQARQFSVIRVNFENLNKGKQNEQQSKGKQTPSSSLRDLTNKVLACNPPDLKRIGQHINQYASDMTISNISAVLYQCSRKKVGLSDKQLGVLICFLQKREEHLRNSQASNLLFSCKNLKNNERQALDLVETISVKLSKSTDGPFSSQAVGNSLFGLQHLSNTSSEMKNLFRILTLKIITCEESMKPQELCNALFGLKHMNASSSEMRRLLSFFSEQISKMENSFTGQGLATAICGLERMDTDVHEVRMVMSALTEKIHANPQASFTEEGISMALYSFRNKNNHCDEARSLLDVLSVRLLNMESSLFSGQTVGNLLNGLSKVNSTHRVFRDLISRITEKIEVDEDFVPVGKQVDTWQMNQHDIFKAFCGLYNLNSDHVEVRQLLTVLVDRLNRQDELLLADAEATISDLAVDSRTHQQPVSTPVLGSKVMANSLYSLRNMQNNRNEVNYLLKWIESRLTDSLQALEAATEGKEADAIRKNISFNPSEIRKSLFGLRSMRMPSRGQDMTCAVKDTNLCRMLSAFNKLLLATSPATATATATATARTMSLEQLSIAVFGLRGLHGSHPEVDALLQYFMSHHSRHLQPESLCQHSADVLNTRLARVLYGLQGKLCDGNEGGSAFMELLSDILEHPELDFTFSPKSFCISICGLGNMDTVSSNSAALGGNDALRLGLLGGIVKRAPEIVPRGAGAGAGAAGESLEDPHMDQFFPSYGQVLLGLSGMSSDHADVRRALHSLAQTMDSLSSRASDDLSDVIMGFRSLANMSSSFEEVRGVLEFLNERLLRHDLGRISYDDLSDMMLGMRNMHSTHGKVSKVLTNLNNILAEQRCDEKNVLEMRHLAAILFGLQSSSSSDGVVKKILTELCGIIHDREEGIDALGSITGRQLTQILVGMQHMTLDHPEVQKLWSILLVAVDNSPSRITRASTDKALSILRARTADTDTGGKGKGLVEEMERLLNEKNNIHAAAAAAGAVS